MVYVNAEDHFRNNSLFIQVPDVKDISQLERNSYL